MGELESNGAVLSGVFSGKDSPDIVWRIKSVFYVIGFLYGFECDFTIPPPAVVESPHSYYQGPKTNKGVSILWGK